GPRRLVVRGGHGVLLGAVSRPLLRDQPADAVRRLLLRGGAGVLRLACVDVAAAYPETMRDQPALRIERHPLGPRVHVLGLRVHEWHLGALLLVALGLVAVTGVLTGGLLAYAVGLAGCWLVAKDWRDLTG